MSTAATEDEPPAITNIPPTQSWLRSRGIVPVETVRRTYDIKHKSGYLCSENTDITIPIEPSQSNVEITIDDLPMASFHKQDCMVGIFGQPMRKYWASSTT